MQRNVGKRRGERKGREEGDRERRGREEGERGRGKGWHIRLNKSKKRRDKMRGTGGKHGGGRRGPYINSARLLVSIAFSSFSGPGVSAPQQ